MKKRKLINLNWTPRVLSSPKKEKEEEKRGGKDFFSIYAFLPSILRNQNEHEKSYIIILKKKNSFLTVINAEKMKTCSLTRHFLGK